MKTLFAVIALAFALSTLAVAQEYVTSDTIVQMKKAGATEQEMLDKIAAGPTDFHFRKLDEILILKGVEKLPKKVLESIVKTWEKDGKPSHAKASADRAAEK